ncbi:PIN domain-containing protein [Litoribacter alkaliphilus]|uniref:PIN domain-containing protein n=1 Tax=Litoribacter ruber TaxID=702568 RepID=A0AAP2G1C6_9BACT|nr:PIN domain-containing protein [Litoribacter alkaliphilus]MBS9524374.1 PIN domain-containing protein [Litoribacter alkaliphilus]
MDNIFLDTDVILDFLLNREPFSNHMDQLFILSEKGNVNFYASSLSFNNFYYISRKTLGHKKAVKILQELIDTIHVLNVGKEEIKKALDGDFADFEDGLQEAAALNVFDLKAILTRNKKDFKNSVFKILSPEEYLGLNE